ncbi:hypothetical protein DRN93_01265 [archaeon]|nr:MAG: hypothetical protein DRN93_01265 [archaeon]
MKRKLRADEVEKIAHKLSTLFSQDRIKFYDVCGKLILYCLAVGDEFMAEMLWRELRRDLDHVSPVFSPLFRKFLGRFAFTFGGEISCDVFISLKDKVLCLCSEILSGKRVYFWRVLKLLYQVFMKGSIDDILFTIRWLSLVMLKNDKIISLDEILESRGV